jgi:hypothetical protein
MNRRQFTNAALTAIPLSMISTANVHGAEERTLGPKILGLKVNGKGWPFASPPAAMIPSNYVVEEFILQGEARRYVATSAGAMPTNGLWDTKYGDSAPFATRVYVVRPAKSEDFNGVAVVNWQNVTAGFDLGAPVNPEIYRGYAWIGLTTQKIGVDGTPGLTKGLKQWDAERYGELSHPGDAYSYDIFTQLGRCLKSPSSTNTALLGDLLPKTVIATGASQSAMRLGSYINAAHGHERVYDGFHLTVHWGICPPLEEVPLMAMFTPEGKNLTAFHCQIRDDLGVPIINLSTECESRFNYPTRQPDTDTFRFWEVAGASHQSPNRAGVLRKIMLRDGAERPAPPADRNSTEWGYIDDAALRSVVQWAQDGTAPHSFPRLDMNGNTPTSLRRDTHGNVLGGIRVPELEAPIASHLGERITLGLPNPSWLQGVATPFSTEKVASLYPQGRQVAWNRAVDALTATGAVVPEDEAALRARHS